MIPASFNYHRPTDLREALRLNAQYGDEAKLLAGGHSLVPTMKLRLQQPEHMIDLGRVAELKGISADKTVLRIGAMTTHWEVESSEVVRSSLPILSEVASIIADPQVRNRGTMGGSIANADPAADYPASIVALDPELVCVGADGERVVRGTEWFLDLFTTALEEGEILREIRFPLLPARTAACYLKLPHPASRFAVVGVLAVVTLDESGGCADARIGITGAATHATRARRTEEALIGGSLDAEAIEAASRLAPEGLELIQDLHFSAEDRHDLCRVQVQRALAGAVARARTGAFQPAAGA